MTFYNNQCRKILSTEDCMVNKVIVNNTNNPTRLVTMAPEIIFDRVPDPKTNYTTCTSINDSIAKNECNKISGYTYSGEKCLKRIDPPVLNLLKVTHNSIIFLVKVLEDNNQFNYDLYECKNNICDKVINNSLVTYNKVKNTQ